MIDLTRSRIPPYEHQVFGVQWLYDLVRPDEGRVVPGALLLADEMGAGKTKQCIDAAQSLFEDGLIHTVIVVAPAPVRSVWHDDETGELKKHLWHGTHAVVQEYHARDRSWVWPGRGRRLRWIITNYEYLRQSLKRVGRGFTGPNLDPLLAAADGETILILDESSSVKSWKADQTRACKALRRKCGRVWLLNGTPISQSPNDIFAQADIMDPRILGCPNYWTFRARYAVMGGWMQKQIVGWRDLDDLQRRMAPYTLRRLKVECLDLPPKLDPVTFEVTLTTETWRHYKNLRDQLLTWLDENTTATAAQAGTRVMRLAQLTAGFLGGLKDVRPCPDCDAGGVDAAGEPCSRCNGAALLEEAVAPRAIGHEKLDFLLSWIAQRLEVDPDLKLVLWCRFRPEVERLVTQLRFCFGSIRVEALWGGQKKDERRGVLRLLHPDTAPTGPAVVVGTLGTGSVGLNLAAAHEVMYASNSNSLFHRLQSMDRVHRPGQTYPVWYGDVVAVGPKGQKTIDHVIVRALRAREELANWTCAAWVQALREE